MILLPFSSLRQCQSCHGNQQRKVSQSWNKQDTQAHIPSAGRASDLPEVSACYKPQEHFRHSVMWSHQWIPQGFSRHQHADFNFFAKLPIRQVDIVVAPASVITNLPLSQSTLSASLPLHLNPSPLRPHCHADKHIFLWKGVNIAPASTISDPTIQLIAALATQASLHDTSSYGSGLCKFHLFCDIFTIPESDRLPTSFPLLYSFALWAVTDPSMLEPGLAVGV